MHPILPLAGLALLGGGLFLYDKKSKSGSTPGSTSTGKLVIPTDPSNPKSAAANATAHLTQPTPSMGPQPPLPPVPPPGELPPGTKAIVSTKETGQAGALRVRSAPSTVAPPVPGGEPGQGGGVPHGDTVFIDGQEEAGFVHIKYPTKNLAGFVWAGYLTKVPAMSSDIGMEPSFEEQLGASSNLGSVPRGYASFTDYVKTHGKALRAAHALYAYLKSGGTDGIEREKMTKLFQKTHNMDRMARAIGGHLRSDGKYDPLTSAALTMYTGDPMPGDMRYQPKPATIGQVLTNKVIGENGSNTGVTYRSGFNASKYLQRYGEDGSTELQMLVQQFQHDMNTDPLFPGPSYKPSPKPAKLYPQVVETGDLGPLNSTTRRALSMLGLYVNAAA